jgi:hypothetical protein
MSDEDSKTRAKGGRMAVESDPETATGVYSNLMLVSHRKEEFVLDFLFVEPQAVAGGQKARLRARAITSPEHAKRIIRALQENVNRYEKRFGPIEEATDMPRALH